MNYLRELNRNCLRLLLSILVLNVLFGQSVSLHIHSFDHDPHQNHHDTIEQVEHKHINAIHHSLDDSHGSHHQGGSPVIDANPDGILKQAAAILQFVAIIVFLIVALSPIRNGWRKYDNSRVKFSQRFFLSPPLRAPPA